MKKIAVVLMSLILTFCLFGCGNNGSDTVNNTENGSGTSQNTNEGTNGNGGVIDDMGKATEDITDGVKDGAEEMLGGDNTNNGTANNTADDLNNNTQGTANSQTR